VSIPNVVPEIMRGAGPLDVAGDYHLAVTGASGSVATTPDVAALGITGDMEVRFDATLDTWFGPVGTGTELIGQFAPPSNQQWLVWVNANRQLIFRHSTDGTAIIDNACPAPLPRSTGRQAFSILFDANNGAAGHTVTFLIASTIAGPWTTLGVKTTAGTTSIFNSTATLGVGNVPTSGFNAPAGRIHAAAVYADLVGSDVRANPDFTAQNPGTTSFVDGAGRTWTVGAAAEIAGFDWEPIPNDSNDRPRLKDLTWQVGRTDELDTFPPSTASAEFRSNDRLLDPEYTSGEYFGDLLPQVPLRFRSEDPDADLFYGFPHSGWLQVYDPPYASRCSVDMVDLLGVIQDWPLPASAYDAAIMASAPKAFWKLDESTGTQMFDSSGNGFHGLRDNGEPADPLVFGGEHSFYAPHVGDNRGQFSGAGLPTGPPCTLEAWVQTPRDAAAVKSILVAQRDYTLGSALWLQIETSVTGSPNGELVINFFGLGGFYKARGHTRIDDNRPHHVVCTIGSSAAADILLYVDGVLQTKTLIAGTTGGSWTGHLIWTVANTTNTGQGDYGIDGMVDEAAIYDRALTAEEVAEHYEAGTTAFDGELTGARINRVLDILGVPESLRDIAAGDTTVGAADYGGDTAGSYLDRVVESERGALFVDHPGGGTIKFLGRYHRFTDTRSTTSQATFTDDPDSADWKYRREIRPEPNGMGSIVNVVDVTWRGGTEQVVDVDSRTRYGPRNRSITTEAPTPESARSSGEWMVARHAQPQSRIRELPLTPGGSQAGLDAVVIGQRISDRVTVRRRPVNVGAPIVNELFVEGIRNEMTTDQSWIATYNTSSADGVGDAWIWDSSTWGETCVWG
jgi:hypothetical protein